MAVYVMMSRWSGLMLSKSICGLLQLGQNFSQPPEEDVHYVRTRNMLTRLGLQTYEKNFKKGLLTDNTLPLLNDRQVFFWLISFHVHFMCIKDSSDIKTGEVYR